MTDAVTQPAPKILTQAAPLQSLDLEARTVEVIFTSGQEVNHYVRHPDDGWRYMPTRVEVTDAAIDLEFLTRSGAVLDSHSEYSSHSVIGCVEDAWIENGLGKARLRFADTSDTADVWNKVAQGILRNVSAGFTVLDSEIRAEPDAAGVTREVMVFTKIRVEEISMVARPADRGAYVQAADTEAPTADAAGGQQETQAAAAVDSPDLKKDETMKQDGTAAAPAATNTPDSAVTTQAAPQPAPQPAPAPSADEIRQAERDRMTEIDAIGRQLGSDDKLIQAAKQDGTSADDFRRQAVDAFASQGTAVANVGGPTAAATVTGDVRDRFIQGATLGLMARAGMAGGERNEFSGYTLAELARQSLVIAGAQVPQNRMEMIGEAFVQMGGAHTTSDFANVLSSVMGKAALKGWEEAPETYQMWTSEGVLTDFKETKRVGLGLVDALPVVAEGAEYKYGTIGDRGETIVLATYGRILNVTRQAIINDDLSLFNALPVKMGRAARRTIGNLAYAVLTSNPTMSDGTALFASGHNNVAGSGGAPSVTTLSAGRTAMMTQKESDGGSALNIRPAYLLVPSALETSAQQLMSSIVDPQANKGHANNPVAGMAEVVADARLDDDSATQWYLAADPDVHDTVEVAFLDGVTEPYIEQKDGWTRDGVEVKVRMDAGVAPTDHRGLYRNAGA